MSVVNWQQFGLRGNPYDTTALTEGGVLALKDAFIGRTREREYLDGLLRSESRLALALCGDTGVGKTSLANYEKYLWKSEMPKRLFSFRREIEANEDLLSKPKFLLEIIASIIREIRLVDTELLKQPVLAKLDRIIDVTETIALSANISAEFMGYGGGIGGSKDIVVSQPLNLPTATIERYFTDVLSFLKGNKVGGKQYEGLIVHTNNFDVLMKYRPEQVMRFFDDIRDILQTRDVYFLFLGPKNFYRDVIDTNQRVKSIFSPAPLVVRPLEKKEVLLAFEERMRLLKSEGVAHFIKPVDDETVFKIYDLYHGDIRSIMTAISDLLGQYSERVGKQLSVDEAALLLSEERWKRIEQLGIKGEQREVLACIVKQPALFSKTDIAKQLNKQMSSMSQYYFPPLEDNGVIVEKERKGNSVYFGLSVDYEPLRWIFEMKQRAETRAQNITNAQASLFEA
jgi:DNA-binding transcriptional ArsR family regulator